MRRAAAISGVEIGRKGTSELDVALDLRQEQLNVVSSICFSGSRRRKDHVLHARGRPCAEKRRMVVS